MIWRKRILLLIKGEKKLAEKDSFLSDCCQAIIKEYHVLSNKDIIQANFFCEKCGKYIKIYPNREKAKEMDERQKEKALVDFWRSELKKRGYHVIEDKEYSHHNEVLLRELQSELADGYIEILGEVKDDKAIIYFQSIGCCEDVDKEEWKPIKLPLIQLPADKKDIKYFDYFPFSWKYLTWGQDKEAEKGTLKSIWEDRNKPSLLGTDFPKAKTELMEELKNKGFQWEGGEKKDNYIKAICPRCGWTYNCELTEKYLKVEEQKEMAKAVKKHEC
ncbi:hypothetical protein [endosymbiont GvMRE of Glomus versiforme]|uniref:hypothetical protein n=1 Tax=endosymbiont GvMRE of Glomus versiforme TaxID=2039283 RepID=UPI0011C4AD28|nr:hypothetical protein [endosymbiont GvMRE of Glomus versiforme]